MLSLSALMAHITRANNGASLPGQTPWYFRGEAVGHLAPAAVPLASQHFGPALDAQNSDQLDALCNDIRDQIATRWHTEAFGLYTLSDQRMVATVPRGCVPYLGIQAFGVHANGFVREHGELKMWVAKRSETKPTFPGQWDNMVGGGLTAGMSPDDVLAKEAEEEAALDMSRAISVQPAGILSYCHASDGGLRNNALYLYDIEVPAGWTPTPNDGEVERFELWDMPRLRACIEHTCDFKYNCNLVIMDFMLRHGVIDANEPGYERLKSALNERFQAA
ncbi:NUDIX hydrolase [Litorivicinus lipolyticus]|uniref:NUDIX hydrolase n=1 Tax=Litorivicinus lipolyticus TaxID=418701 RepID=UPI003B5C09A5